MRSTSLLPLAIALLILSGPSATLAQERPDPRAGVFSTEQAYPSKFVRIDGVKMHYVEGGVAANASAASGASETPDQVFLFLHGNPTSSYLWRNVMPHMESLGRVIAIDLVGFGKSGKPDIAYTFQDHSRFVDGFIKELGLNNIILVIHDWGSMLGFDYARRHPNNVKGIAFMEAIVPPAFPAESYEAEDNPEVIGRNVADWYLRTFSD